MGDFMDRNSRALWENHFKKFETSGLSKGQYCERNKLSKPLFFKWQNILRPDLKTHKKVQVQKQSSSFVSLKEKPSEKILIKLSSGIELTFSTDTSPRWIASFLKELESTHA